MFPAKLFLLAVLAFVTTAHADELTCDGDYSKNGNWCYKLMSVVDSFGEADQICKAKAGNVASIHSKAENTVIASFGVEVFIGLQYNPQAKNYSWTDGTPFDIKMWEENYPVSPEFYGNCVKMQKSGKWVNFECNWKAQYVCKKAALSHQCPVPPNNQLFISGKVSSPGYPGNYINGLSCSYLLLVHNDRSVEIEIPEMIMGDGDAIEIFSGLVANNDYRIAVLSGNLTGESKKYSTPEKENKMSVKFTSKSQNGGYWRFEFKEGDCPSGWLNGGEIGLGNCYQLIEQEGTFDEAKKICEQHAAFMISVQNAWQNEFIKGIMKKMGYFRNWLGLVYEEGSWRWSDGAVTRYTNWDNGQPNLQTGYCALINDDGKWVTEDCGERHTPICYVP